MREFEVVGKGEGVGSCDVSKQIHHSVHEMIPLRL